MSAIYDIADRHVEAAAALSPTSATFAGIPGHDSEITDFSPEGLQRQDSLNRETLAAVSGATEEREGDRVLKEFIQGQLQAETELHRMGEPFRDLNVLYGPIQGVRMCFDLMPRNTEEDWATIAARLAVVPRGIRSHELALREGMRRGMTAARRQVEACARQAETWSGTANGPSFFDSLLAEYDAGGPGIATLRRDMEAGVRSAAQAYAGIAGFLREVYLPRASQRDAVGRERYAAHSLLMNGTLLDLEETYAWGWDQLRWVEGEMAVTAGRILPGSDVLAAIQLLETDPERGLDDADGYRGWAQDLLDRTISELDGVHFDLPDKVKRVEALVPPRGGALAPYYTPPTEDLARPGRVWFPTGDRASFPMWSEVTTVYHEGVPGHHFQVGTTAVLTDRLSRYQRKWAWSPAHGEGWALYAERLMGELGYLDNPDFYMGMLSAQALRCVRVIIDIGMHLELAIPAAQAFHPGETWNAGLGLEFMRQRSLLQEEFLKSEVDRYLGVPAQAISYKVGERAWLEARDQARRRRGASFDLRDWHNRALGLGPMGLDQMIRELALL